MTRTVMISADATVRTEQATPGHATVIDPRSTRITAVNACKCSVFVESRIDAALRTLRLGQASEKGRWKKKVREKRWF